MLSQDSVRELRCSWLPNITEAGLERIIDLLEKGSPLLIHGCFTRSLPMGCLATHAAWHHPRTAHLTVEAGVTWLNRVAGLNPATSHVIRDWDAAGPVDWEIRAELIRHFKEERDLRRKGERSASRLPALVQA